MLSVINKIILVFLFISLGNSNTVAQIEGEIGKTRIFPTYKDFVLKKPIIVGDTLFLNKGDSSLFKQRGIWGFENNTGLYRVFENKIFLIEDTSGLIVYSVDTLKNELNLFYFLTTGFPLDDRVERKNYFFSTFLNDKILELSLKNLELKIDNSLFIKKAKKRFRWYNYDFHERYKSGQFMLNRLYNKYNQ